MYIDAKKLCIDESHGTAQADAARTTAASATEFVRRCGITCHGRPGSVGGHTTRPDRGANRDAAQDEEKAWREKERQRGGAR